MRLAPTVLDSALGIIWWTRGPPNGSGALWWGGPSGLVCWGARFGGLVDLRHHWVDSWTSEPLNIISSQVDFGVQPGGLHCFWVLFCKNPSGLPGGLAPLRSPPLLLQGFRMASGRSVFGSRGSLCRFFLVRTIASAQLDPSPGEGPPTLLCYFC